MATLIEQLPTQKQVADVFASLTGGEGGGAGLGQARQVLESLDLVRMVQDLVGELERTGGSLGVSSSPSQAMEGLLGDFRQAFELLPKDPRAMLRPLTEKLDRLSQLLSAEDRERLFADLLTLQSSDALPSVNLSAVTAGLSTAFDNLRSDLLGGTFGQLKDWSEMVGSLRDELAPILEADGDEPLPRLIQWVGAKAAGINAALLPGADPLRDLVERSDGLLVPRSEPSNLLGQLTGTLRDLQSQVEGGAELSLSAVSNVRDRMDDLARSLSDSLDEVTRTVQPALGGIDGLQRALESRFSLLESAEIVDLGNVRDFYRKALGDLQNRTRELDITSVRQRIDEVFAPLDRLFSQLDPETPRAAVARLAQQIRSLGDSLQAAIFEITAWVRDLLRQLGERLDTLVLSVGETDANGEFRFHIQQEIEDFLTGVESMVDEGLDKALDNFRGQIKDALGKVSEATKGLDQDLETARLQLESMLSNLPQRLDDIGLKAKIDELRARLETMVVGVGNVDFDAVVNPVILQIDSMRDQLAEIDLSSLNPALRDLLNAGLQVVSDIDFHDEISVKLLKRMNELLDVPRKKLTELQGAIQMAVEQAAQVSAEKLVAPLEEVFNPVREALESLSLNGVLAPVDEWHGRIVEEIDGVSPAALLEPVVDLHRSLLESAETLSPSTLIEPLGKALEEARAELDGIDVSTLSDGVSDGLQQVTDLLDEVSPERLVEPLVQLFDELDAALESYRPSILLKPVGEVFDLLARTLSGLNDEHAELLAKALEPLRRLPAAYDPNEAVAGVRKVSGQALSVVESLDVGEVVAELDSVHKSLQAAVKSASPSVQGVTDALAGLSPFVHPQLGEVTRRTQALKSQLRELAGDIQLPTALGERYATLKPRVESLVPDWIRDDLSVDAVRKAVRNANPLDVADEADALFEMLREQMRGFHPATLANELNERLLPFRENLEGFDSQAVVGELSDALEDVVRRITSVSLDVIDDELAEEAQEIKDVVRSLDPSQVIAGLQAISQQVSRQVKALNPTETLGDLGVEDLLETIAQFDPAALAQEVITGSTEKVQDRLSDLDFSSVLDPLADKVDQLGEQLEDGLKRTESAFNEMLRAVPA